MYLYEAVQRLTSVLDESDSWKTILVGKINAVAMFIGYFGQRKKISLRSNQNKYPRM